MVVANANEINVGELLTKYIDAEGDVSFMYSPSEELETKEVMESTNTESLKTIDDLFVEYYDTIGPDEMPSLTVFEQIYNEGGEAWNDLTLKKGWIDAINNEQISRFAKFEDYKASSDYVRNKAPELAERYNGDIEAAINDVTNKVTESGKPIEKVVGEIKANIDSKGEMGDNGGRGERESIEQKVFSSAKENIISQLSRAQGRHIRRLDNIIENNLTDNDFSGTLEDLQGNPIPKESGGFWDHLTEMKQSYKALLNIKRGLEGSLKNPNLALEVRMFLIEELNSTNFYIKKIENLFKKFGGIANEE